MTDRIVPDFQFKQFTLRQDRCAMKVGTDGILLGAWASANAPNRILDIGTGTGLIALMLAQRFPEAMIDAIEINSAACEQATDNFEASPWNDRVTAIHAPAQNFESQHQYSLITCNPPWFSKSLKSDAPSRNTARHDDSLKPADLLDVVKRLLHSAGTYCTILPVNEGQQFIQQANAAGLHCRRCCEVRPNPGSTPKRLLLEFGYGLPESDLQSSSIVIETERRHEYTPEYKTLTKDFYLRF